MKIVLLLLLFAATTNAFNAETAYANKGTYGSLNLTKIETRWINNTPYKIYWTNTNNNNNWGGYVNCDLSLNQQDISIICTIGTPEWEESCFKHEKCHVDQCRKEFDKNIRHAWTQEYVKTNKIEEECYAATENEEEKQYGFNFNPFSRKPQTINSATLSLEGKGRIIILER